MKEKEMYRHLREEGVRDCSPKIKGNGKEKNVRGCVAISQSYSQIPFEIQRVVVKKNAIICYTKPF